jgi:hypothetical protein
MSSLEASKHRPGPFQRTATFAAAVTLTASIYSACSTGSVDTIPRGQSGSSGNNPGSGGSGLGGSGTGGGSVGGSLNFDSGFGDATTDGECGGNSLEPESVTVDTEVTEEVTERAPADVFIMFDQSVSMEVPEGSTTRWAGVTQATIAFVQSQDSAGLGVGIQFFGAGTANGAAGEDCLPARYAQPQVPIALLPGNAPAIVNAINGHSPSSETPTTAALTGAITYARGWKNQNPTHPVFVLLVTDGQPEVPISSTINPLSNCFNGANLQDLAGTVAAAQTGFSGSPSIPTYVLGVGPNLANLDQIAVAGGTQKAYLISGGNVSQEVVTALNTIRGTISHTVTKTVTTTKTIPLECEWVMPEPEEGQFQDPNKVNIKFTSAGTPQELGMVASVDECAAHHDAWYYGAYDDLGHPTKIVACPGICDEIKAANDARVDILVGCNTKVF